MKPELKAKPSFQVDEEATVTIRPSYVDDMEEMDRNAPDWLSKEARLVRSAYIAARTRYEQACKGMTGVYVPNLKMDGRSPKYRGDKIIEKAVVSDWQQIADLCIAEKINPKTYIATIFASLDPHAKMAPNPNYFYGQKALDRWRLLRRGQERSIELSLRSETEAAANKMGFYLSMGFKKRRAYRTTLLDDSLGLSPLFRYCVAVSLNYDDIAEHFYEAAVTQFAEFDRYYLKFWAEMLPKGFAKRALADFEKLIRGNHG